MKLTLVITLHSVGGSQPTGLRPLGGKKKLRSSKEEEILSPASSDLSYNINPSRGLQPTSLSYRFWTCSSHNHVSQLLKLKILSILHIVCGDCWEEWKRKYTMEPNISLCNFKTYLMIQQILNPTTYLSLLHFRDTRNNVTATCH